MTDKLTSSDLLLIVIAATRQMMAEIGRLSGDQKDAALDALIDRIQVDVLAYTDAKTGLPRYDTDQVRMLIRGLDPRRAIPSLRN